MDPAVEIPTSFVRLVLLLHVHRQLPPGLSGAICISALSKGLSLQATVHLQDLCQLGGGFSSVASVLPNPREVLQCFGQRYGRYPVQVEPFQLLSCRFHAVPLTRLSLGLSYVISSPVSSVTGKWPFALLD